MTQTTQNFVFKSIVFGKKQFLLKKEKLFNGNSLQIKNSDTLNERPQSNKCIEINQGGNKDNNPENNRLLNKNMTNSSFFAIEHKRSNASIFKMGREVSQPTQETNNIKNQIQKNVLNFLEVPKLNVIKPKNDQNTDTKLSGSFIFSQFKQIKAPSFLKKSTKSSCDPNEKYIEEIQKKLQINLNGSCKKNVYLETYSDASSVNSNNPKNKIEPYSSLATKNKVSYSPINSQNSVKKSLNQSKQLSPLSSGLLDPKLISAKNQRKGSMQMQLEKDFYTPTQKNSSKLGSPNFIQILEKQNTAKYSNKSGVLDIPVNQCRKNSNQILSARNQQKKSKTSIPSFIKFKQKQNEIIKKSSTIQTKTSFEKSESKQSLREHQITIDDFKIKERLGKGAFGDVFLAQQKKTGLICVLKKLSKKKIKQQRLEQLILRQIKIQAYLTHKHLTKLYGFFDNDEYIYLILEYLSGGSLAQKFNRKKCPEMQVASYVKQVCQGLRFMHIENIIHRDIKPQNIFVHDDYIKIGDFGCSVFSDSKRNTMVGCLAYISPEQLNQQSYDEKIDVWSIGILCYELLTGRPPFEDDIIKIARQQKQAKLSELRFPSKLQLSEDAKSFTKNLLQQIPQNRMTISEALKHPFIVKNNMVQNIFSLSQSSLKQI